MGSVAIPDGLAQRLGRTERHRLHGDEEIVDLSKYPGGYVMTYDPKIGKYENLSMIILNARDPGVTLNFRKMITGKSQRSFIIKDVRVPLEDVIGGEGGGWKVAQTLLDVEHGGMGVTLDERKAIEEREREYWGRPPKPTV